MGRPPQAVFGYEAPRTSMQSCGFAARIAPNKAEGRAETRAAIDCHLEPALDDFFDNMSLGDTNESPDRREGAGKSLRAAAIAALDGVARGDGGPLLGRLSVQ